MMPGEIMKDELNNKTNCTRDNLKLVPWKGNNGRRTQYTVQCYEELHIYFMKEKTCLFAV